MKPGDRVIWLHSPGRSFLSGWRLQEIPGVIVRFCRRRIRIRVEMGGREKVATVDPENVIRHQNHRDVFRASATPDFNLDYEILFDKFEQRCIVGAN